MFVGWPDDGDPDNSLKALYYRNFKGPGLHIVETGSDAVIDTCAEAHGDYGCCEGKTLHFAIYSIECPVRCGWSITQNRYSCSVGINDPDAEPTGAIQRGCGEPFVPGACKCSADADCPEGKICRVVSGSCQAPAKQPCSFDKIYAVDTNQCEECLSDEDCKGNSDGSHCLPDRECSCRDSSGCAGTNWPVCVEREPINGGKSCKGCATDADCSNPKLPRCQADGICVECASDFDCIDPAKPKCNFFKCTEGTLCSGGNEAMGEPDDDGPVSATKLVMGKPLSRDICDQFNDNDFFSVDLSPGGRAVAVRVEPAEGSPKIRVEALDPNGRLLGESPTFGPLLIELRHLPAMRLYFRVSGGESGKGTYSIQLLQNEADPCQNDGDCTVSWQSELLRGKCDPGSQACVFRSGMGAVPIGQPCDSWNDCETGVCAHIPHTPSSPSENVCTVGCDSDANCEGIPGTYCGACTPSKPYLCVILAETQDDCGHGVYPNVVSSGWWRDGLGPDGRCY